MNKAAKVHTNYRLSDYVARLRKLAANQRIGMYAIDDVFYAAEVEEIADILEGQIKPPSEGS